MATAVASHQVSYDAHVAADLTNMAVARDALVDALDECSWSPEDAFRVLICADEAMANALDHGSDTAGAIEIAFRVDAAAAAVLITDHSSDAPDTPSSPEAPAESCEHGRGLLLMRALSDRFRIWRRPTGTMVALDFRVAKAWAR